MLKIRHLALACQSPGKAAAFYKEAFGWREVSRTGKDMNDPGGVVLSDGSLNITLLRFQTDQIGKGIRSLREGLKGDAESGKIENKESGEK